MMKKLYTMVVFIFFCLLAGAQNITPEQYIEQYKDLAIREMKRMGVPAAITLAQGLLETENGNSVLVKKSNNHFGIKCKSSWTGNSVSHDDDAPGECFRTYKSAEDSYRDHSTYLRGNDRYASLFDLNPADYKGWAYGLKKAGYATNPKYPAILIKSIEQYNLQQYSLDAVADMPKFEKTKFEDDKEVPFVYVEEDAGVKKADVKKEEAPVTPELTDEVTHVNHIKCVMAVKGTSLLAIATKHDISLSRLLLLNDMMNDGILEKDQPVYLEKKATQGDTYFYITKKGETLHDVAQKYALQLEYLVSYNRLSKNAVISEGTKLFLQAGNTDRQVQQAPAKQEVKSAEVKYHQVQPKEGLYAIAKKYAVSVQQLKEWNDLTSDNLSVGQQLIISK